MTAEAGSAPARDVSTVAKIGGEPCDALLLSDLAEALSSRSCGGGAGAT